MCPGCKSNLYFMRSVIIKAVCIAAILGSPWIASSQQYYVVVGAFAAEENASEFKGYLPGQELDTSYADSEKGNLLHFYVLKTSDKESAISKTLKLKKEIDAWSTTETPMSENQLEGRISGLVTTASEPDRKNEVPAEGATSAVEGSAASGAVSAGTATAGKYRLHQ